MAHRGSFVCRLDCTANIRYDVTPAKVELQLLDRRQVLEIDFVEMLAALQRAVTARLILRFSRLCTPSVICSGILGTLLDFRVLALFEGPHRQSRNAGMAPQGTIRKVRS